eukprot:CAMPEP_0206062044 /NCGR_PEP_ID=MMETSP1466-20131121/55893_1 /ASSEMBLY_ACC=CAM_ASM_001126 /TAXON_ID=44452 /ORGANISM="Pavlova gyrans, Strain CCMP608" /LENGTH=100 /DNA_ID=CAMNT_0053437401 /DNA_START=94 /DNA_END=396 /DNA_ORIENTATION=-
MDNTRVLVTIITEVSSRDDGVVVRRMGDSAPTLTPVYYDTASKFRRQEDVVDASVVAAGRDRPLSVLCCLPCVDEPGAQAAKTLCRRRGASVLSMSAQSI